MSRIDSSRISEVIKALRASGARSSSEKVKSLAVDNSSKSQAATVIEGSRKVAELKVRIASKLSEVRSRSTETDDEVISLVAIQEIMHWEFGDEILNHPEFKKISSEIVARIHNSPEAARQFKGLLQEF